MKISISKHNEVVKLMQDYVRQHGTLDGFSHPDITFLNMDNLKEIKSDEIKKKYREQFRIDMKHKLINNNTREEILCDKITIDGFDYYVSDEKYIEDELLYCVANGWLQKARVEHLVEQRGEDNQWKKVIATNNPNIDIPKVVDEVENLFTSVSKNPPYTKIVNRNAVIGYAKSQETHPFSEEDMIEFAEFMFSVCKEYQRGGTYVVSKPLDGSKTYTTKEILQLWKEQQPKIVYYE